jgi:hypothetical protein
MLPIGSLHDILISLINTVFGLIDGLGLPL